MSFAFSIDFLGPTLEFQTPITFLLVGKTQSVGTVNLVLVGTAKNNYFFSVYELIQIIFLKNGTVRTNKMKF